MLVCRRADRDGLARLVMQQPTTLWPGAARASAHRVLLRAFGAHPCARVSKGTRGYCQAPTAGRSLRTQQAETRTSGSYRRQRAVRFAVTQCASSGCRVQGPLDYRKRLFALLGRRASNSAPPPNAPIAELGRPAAVPSSPPTPIDRHGRIACARYLHRACPCTPGSAATRF